MEVGSARGRVEGAIEERALGIIRELLIEMGSPQAAEKVSLHSSLERDLGLGSLERVELLVRYEARFNTRLPDDIAQRAETPRDWVHALLENGRGKPAQVRYEIKQPTRDAPPAPESARTLAEVLRRHAEIEPDRVHIHLLEDDSGQDITCRKLLETASSVASGLVAGGLRPNDTAAIMLPTCADFFYAFFGIILAGGIPVPIYPPAQPEKIEEYVRRQVAILRNAEVRFLIGFDRVKAVSKILKVSIPSLQEATTVEALREAGAGLPTPARQLADVATLQYTSGSTGDPKGVVLSHSNILANIRGIGWSVQVRPTDVGVSWLPLYHDMGLIGSWLFCLYYAVPITILSPIAFLSRPERWLWALHNSQGTLCPAPNFSYELCARRIPEAALEGLDLSAWRVAINAGEPVLPETLARFAERFESYGFRAESFVPCYGLAESSVALTFPPLNRRPAIDAVLRGVFESEGKAVPAGPADSNVVRFVSNGTPMPGHEVRILDEHGREAGERAQGRLFFRGPSRTAGYYRNPQATAAVVTEDGWMDSGDLAYWAGGELHVTGRCKDCIIKSGRNIVPQEVEAAAAEVRGVRRGCVAAFGLVDSHTGTERLVVVAETRATDGRELNKIESDVIQEVGAVLGIPPDKVVLVGPRTIPKTPSGKIRRNETRSLYERGKLKVRSRPPWVQILRLWLANLDAWAEQAGQRARARLYRTYVRACLLATAPVMGVLARLTASPTGAAKVVQAAARFLMRLTRSELDVRGADLVSRDRAAVLVANRAGRMDPLVLAATIPSPFFIAEGTALASLPPETRFLFRPLLLREVNGNGVLAGGTLRQRIREELEAGRSVLVFSEGPVGAPAHRIRFRLDAIHAAAGSCSPIHPIGIRGTSRIFEPASRQVSRMGRPKEARVAVGAQFRVEKASPHEIARWRERVKAAIAQLSGPADGREERKLREAG